MSSGFANVRQGLAISAGSGSVQTGWASFVNSFGVSFGASLSASSLVVTASAQTVQGGVGSYSAGTTQITSGTAVLSQSGGLSFGANGQTITAALSGLSYWDNSLPPEAAGTVTNHGNMALQRISIGLPLTATRADGYFSFNNGAGLAILTTATLTLSLLAYTFNHSTLSLASSGTIAVTYQLPANAGIQAATLFQSVPLGTWNLTPGEYVLGSLLFAQSSIFGAGSTNSLFSAQAFGSKYPPTILNPGGGNFSAYVAAGAYSTTTSAAPNSIQLSEIVQTFSNNDAWIQPFIKLASA